MFGFNWIDVIIVLILFAAVAGSIKVGFLTQVCVIIGFFGALFLAGWILPHILPIADRTLRTLVNVNLVLLASGYAAIRGFDLGQHYHWSFRRTWSLGKRIESWLGVLPGVAACLIAIWLLSVMVARLPFAALSNSVNDAKIVQTLNSHLPPVPAVFAKFNQKVDPSSQPYVFADPKTPTTFAFNPEQVQQAAAKATTSVVRITSFGCGGIQTGSGFVAAPGLVITNAHVIAGVERPIVKYNNLSYEGVTVLFNPNLDFAVLRVPGLTAPHLRLASEVTANGTSVAVAGYPGGNYAASPAIIRNHFNVFGRNIYDIGVIGREVYEVQSTLAEGSSGGPIVLSDGRVAGVVFSKSSDVPDYAYALTSTNLRAGLDRAKESYRRVSTGACLAN